MAITKEQKKTILDDTLKILSDAESLVFVNFKGIGVNDTVTLRKELKKEGINYRVIKKTLLRKALEDKKVEGELPSLEGELAIAYGDDALSPARETYAFEKKFKGGISLLGGIFEGKFADRDKMVSIATIPPMPVLYGQFVNLIHSPIQGLVMAIDQIAQKKETAS